MQRHVQLNLALNLVLKVLITIFPEQVDAILELRLHRLTGLATEEVINEYKELLVKIAELLHIINSPERLMEVIREELEQVRAQFADERRTEITAASGDIDLEDLIAQEDVVVTLSHEGYVKYQPLTDYEAQRRGGKGKSATKMKDEDFIEKLLVANTHDTILCFSSRGRLYWLKVYQYHKPAVARVVVQLSIFYRYKKTSVSPQACQSLLMKKINSSSWQQLAVL